jgi:hypothetical protein
MLIDFTFGNFRSFRDRATLSLVAAEGLADAPRELTERNVAAAILPGLDILRLAAIYGANASGKSNVIRSLNMFLEAVHTSADSSYTFTGIPFAYDVTSFGDPIYFDATFVNEGPQCRYGFVVGVGADSFEFLEEWLFEVRDGREVQLFGRHGFDVIADGFHEVEAVLEDGCFTRADALLLSVAAMIPKNRFAARLVQDLGNIQVISGLNDDRQRQFTERMLERGKFTREIQELLAAADTGIVDVVMLAPDDPGITNVLAASESNDSRSSRQNEQILRDLRVIVSHRVFDADGTESAHRMNSPLFVVESEGTKKLFMYAGRIFDSLENGHTLVVDEMDARFHPLLTRAIVNLFQSPTTNPRNAQLIFTTHDTNLLDARLFRRDQIWFVEKDPLGRSHLYSLSEFNVDAKHSEFAPDYVAGRYGGIPFLSGMSDVLNPSPVVEDDAASQHGAVGSNGVHASA